MHHMTDKIFVTMGNPTLMRCLPTCRDTLSIEGWDLTGPLVCP